MVVVDGGSGGRGSVGWSFQYSTTSLNQHAELADFFFSYSMEYNQTLILPCLNNIPRSSLTGNGDDLELQQSFWL
ncbi:hypothetical protein Tco_1245100 [Tanacetum coccineum]